MTGGTVVVLGPVGANFGAGHDRRPGLPLRPDAAGTPRRSTSGASPRSGSARSWPTAAMARRRVVELVRLLEAHRDGRLRAGRPAPPRGRPRGDVLAGRADRRARSPATGRAEAVATSQPDRNPTAARSTPTAERSVPTLDRSWGSRHPRGACARGVAPAVKPASAAREVRPMIHPSDPELRTIAVRDGQQRPGHLRRLRLPPGGRPARPASTSTRSAAATPAAAGSTAPMRCTTPAGRPIAVAV